MEEQPRSGLVISNGFQVIGCLVFAIVAALCGAVLSLWISAKQNDSGPFAGFFGVGLGLLLGAIVGAVYGGVALPWAFNGPAKSRRRRQLRIGSLLALTPCVIGLTLLADCNAKSIQEGPSDSELIATFHTLQPQLHEFVRLATRPISSKAKHPHEETNEISLVLTQEELGSALAKLRDTAEPIPGARTGIRIIVWGREDRYWYSGSEKGIEYLPTPPKDTEDSELVEYHHIEGNWYIYARYYP